MSTEQCAMLALESLTPGGSEYVADPERCVWYVRELIRTGGEAKKDRARIRREYAEVRKDLNERIKWLEGALEARIAERDTAARLLTLAIEAMA